MELQLYYSTSLLLLLLLLLYPLRLTAYALPTVLEHRITSSWIRIHRGAGQRGDGDGRVADRVEAAAVRGKCAPCGRCEAVQVPVAPRVDSRRGGQERESYTDYKPLNWRCRCADRRVLDP